MSRNERPRCGRILKQLPHSVNGYARVAIDVRYVVEIPLNSSEIAVVLELDAAVEFQVVQRPRHTAIRQPSEWFEFKCCAFRTCYCFRDTQICQCIRHGNSKVRPEF
jgi:hypothetical protein